jgi:hypothetical protein
MFPTMFIVMSSNGGSVAEGSGVSVGVGVGSSSVGVGEDVSGGVSMGVAVGVAVGLAPLNSAMICGLKISITITIIAMMMNVIRKLNSGLLLGF